METTSPYNSTSRIFEAGKTYIIDETFTLTENLELPENVTLIFQGGKFVSDNEVEIIGNHTALIAPIAPIFGINVKATGSWEIDRAYPQWFEAKTIKFTTHCATSVSPSQPYAITTEDMADPIQKAIDMTVSGSVYLIGGNYYITKPIFIPLGIILEGQPSQGNTFGSNNILLTANIYPAIADKDSDHFSCTSDNKLEGHTSTFPTQYYM